MALAAAVLRLDANGNPRMVRLLAALVEAESRYFADAASKPAENDLVRAFRGGATPAVPVAEFLERIQRSNYLYGGAVYVLAGAYLVRFMRRARRRDPGRAGHRAPPRRRRRPARRQVQQPEILREAGRSLPDLLRSVDPGQRAVPARIALLAGRRLPHLYRGRRVPALLPGHGARPEGTQFKLRIQEEEGGPGGGDPPRSSIQATRRRVLGFGVKFFLSCIVSS